MFYFTGARPAASTAASGDDSAKPIIDDTLRALKQGEFFKQVRSFVCMAVCVCMQVCVFVCRCVFLCMCACFFYVCICMLKHLYLFACVLMMFVCQQLKVLILVCPAA